MRVTALQKMIVLVAIAEPIIILALVVWCSILSSRLNRLDSQVQKSVGGFNAAIHYVSEVKGDVSRRDDRISALEGYKPLTSLPSVDRWEK